MEVKQWLLYPVSFENHLPTAHNRLREQADKPFYHTSQNVTFQDRFAGCATQHGGYFGRSSTLSLPNSGHGNSVLAFSWLDPNPFRPSTLFTFRREPCHGDYRYGLWARTVVSWRQPQLRRSGTNTPTPACQFDCTMTGDFITYSNYERRIII